MLKRRRNRVRWSQRRALLEADRTARMFEDVLWDLLRGPLYRKYLRAAWHQGRPVGGHGSPLFELAKTLTREHWAA